MSYPALHLKKDQERRLLAGHIWIYSNEVDTQRSPFTGFTPGQLVTVFSHQQKPLGVAYLNPNTLLCARLLSRDIRTVIDTQFFYQRLANALALRERLFAQPFYRWVYAESDDLPGLIIDRYDDVIVAQLNTAGMELCKSDILAAIRQLVPARTVVWRNDSSMRSLEGLTRYTEIAYGESLDTLRIEENACEFTAPLLAGQKTGWFYDHRANRALLTPYAQDKTVLDLFCYLGAFSLPLAKAGAAHVTAVDASPSAIAQLTTQAATNGVADRLTAINSDAFDFLSQAATEGKRYDMIVVDPPAFIKKKKEHPQGLRAYEKINQLALALLNPGGWLLSASCSMHLSSAELLDVLRRASLKARRPLRVLQHLQQDKDHPVHPAIAETFYLKGYLLAVD